MILAFRVLLQLTSLLKSFPSAVSLANRQASFKLCSVACTYMHHQFCATCCITSHLVTVRWQTEHHTFEWRLFIASTLFGSFASLHRKSAVTHVMRQASLNF